MEPVDSVTGLAARRIWFPEGRWYDCATGAMYEGGRTEELHYTLSENPWYARAGAILPMNPQTVKNLQQPCDTLVLTFIPGADGELVHYEDDGRSPRSRRATPCAPSSRPAKAPTPVLPTAAATKCASRRPSRPKRCR